MANGYMGKMLWVDLTKNEIREEVLEEKLCRDYIGGYGIGAKILFDRMKPGTDPIGPEAIFGIIAGPFDGTSALGGSRYTVVGKSPLTGGWGDANSGGNFGPYLKFAGYDAVFFTGISEKPVYLVIDNGKPELKDAAHLWGKDSFDTEDMLIDEHGKGTESVCIGPSGEQVCLIACVMNNKGRAAGRSGLGAVMGSKKLKAVAVRGELKVPQADEAKVKELRKTCQKKLTGHVDMLREVGTPVIFNHLLEAGDTPIKNWDGVPEDFPQFEKIGGNSVMEKVSKKYACYRCPIGCGGHMKAGTGEYKYAEGSHKPEYETLGLFGSSCLNDNLDSIILLNDICNRFGVDTISAGAAIAFTIECYENGLLSKEDTDGIEMTWGNHQSIVAMTQKLVRKEGFGKIIADGVKVAAEKIGKDSEQYAMHIQGQEVPAHSPKFGVNWGICYRLDATPARHTQGGGPFPPGLMPEFDPKLIDGRGVLHKRGSSYNHVINCLGACVFVVGGYHQADVLVDFVNALTGWDFTMDDLLKAGERITNIRQAFNVREGLNSLKFHVPGRIVGKPPAERGPLAGVTVPEEKLNKEYLSAMGWDLQTAKPKRATLLELGMEDVAKALE